MKSRINPRISPYKPLHVEVSSDTTCWTGTVRNISSSGSCISFKCEEKPSIHTDNRLLIRCRLGELNEGWGDEALISRVRWVEMREGEAVIGVEFMDTDAYYHPTVYSLHQPEAI
jgi:PilZ domain